MTWGRKDAEGLGVIVRAQVIGEKEPREWRFDLIQAFPLNSTLWATDPKTQICYTAVRRFGSVAAPGLFMGVPFDRSDDMEPVHLGPDAAKDVTPPRPQRADYQGEHPGLKPEPTAEDAEVVEGPGRTPLVDAVGEVVGEYGPDAFLEEFFAAVGDAKIDRAQRAQMLRNNYETASTLYVQAGKGGMRGFLLDMQDLGFTGDDYREPKPETKETAGPSEPPSAPPAAGEAGAATNAAPAEPIGYPFHSAAGKVLSTSDTPSRFVAAIEDTIRGTLDEGDDPKPFWTANKKTIDACYAANDPDISRRLDILQKEVFGALKGKQGRMV